jgi:hypothetical protein
MRPAVEGGGQPKTANTSTGTGSALSKEVNLQLLLARHIPHNWAVQAQSTGEANDVLILALQSGHFIPVEFHGQIHVAGFEIEDAAVKLLDFSSHLVAVLHDDDEIQQAEGSIWKQLNGNADFAFN